LRIREFDECLKRNKIVKFPKAPRFVKKELLSAAEDLEEAKLGISNGKFKWPTIQAYYSMYHAARALLFSQEYRDKSHYCLYAALKALFVQKGLIEPELVEAFYHAMILRENADYRSRFSKSGAMAVLKRAGEFLDCVRELILGDF
jgi:uncharacterized protein (UPF0332 family)